MRKDSLAGKWRRLSYRRKLVWLKAAFVLSYIGIGLRILPFALFRRVFHYIAGNPGTGTPTAETVEEVVWAVRSAAYRLPMTLLCLPQSLAVKYLLRKAAGVAVYIGVDKDPGKGYLFHAWVEWQGQTVIGELPLKYQPLWVWE